MSTYCLYQIIETGRIVLSDVPSKGYCAYMKKPYYAVCYQSNPYLRDALYFIETELRTLPKPNPDGTGTGCLYGPVELVSIYSLNYV